MQAFVKVNRLSPLVEDLRCNNKAKSILTRTALYTPKDRLIVSYNERWLISYETVVAMIDHDGVLHMLYKVNNNTTARHVNEFINRYLSETDERRDWRKLPVEHTISEEFIQVQ